MRNAAYFWYVLFKFGLTDKRVLTLSELAKIMSIFPQRRDNRRE